MNFSRLAAIPAGRRTKWVVLLVWLAIAAMAGPLGGRLSSVQSNDTASYLPRNAEATKADAQFKRFPQSKQLDALIVYRRDTGLLPADRARADADSATITRRFGGGTIRQPPHVVVSPDSKALLLSVPIANTGTTQAEGTRLRNTVQQLRDTVGQGGGGLRIAVTGPAGFTADSIGVFQQIDSTLLLATAVVVAILLLLTYATPTSTTPWPPRCAAPARRSWPPARPSPSACSCCWSPS
jgi:RND superfamily putative drug exporter